MVRSALKMFLWMIVVTGIAYPFLIFGIARLVLKHRSEGDIIVNNGQVVGARLIGQRFKGDGYFWSRPSAVDYNGLASGGSDMGPTSLKLKRLVEERRKGNKEMPSQLLFASGSGLDPHISPQTARYQVDRIVKARGWDKLLGKQKLQQLITDKTEGRRFGVIGVPVVNVLELNLALDELKIQ